MRLSILICSLISRQNQLSYLLNFLKPQLSKEVEVLVYPDDGSLIVGKKRNELLCSAKGDYISFIDDDDLVAFNYVHRILSSIKSNPDCCGIEGLIFQNKFKSCHKFIHSIKYKEWFTKNNIYYRCPNHLSPVLRELALQILFPEINVGEDKDYSLRLRSLLHKEVYIHTPLYFYLTV